MVETRYRTVAQTQAGARVREVDEGLRSYMLRVYNYMALGVAVTALVSMFMAANPALMQAVAPGPMKWVLFFGLLGLGFFAPRLIHDPGQVDYHAVHASGLQGVQFPVLSPVRRQPEPS